MGFMDKLKELTQPYEDEDDYFEEAEKPVQGYAVKPRPVAPSSAEMEFESTFGAPAASAAAVANASSGIDDEDDDDMSGGLFGNLGKRVKKQQSVAPGREQRTVNFGGKESQVILFNPKTFDEAGEIVSHLNRNHSLVMTLEGLPTETARRLLDFISGIAFALHGKITPVSAKTYFISPDNVDLLSTDNSGK